MLEIESSSSLMEPATHQGVLQRLAQQLQVQARSLPDMTPMQVQCVVRQGNLMVLGQHAPDASPDPHTIFATWQQIIQSSIVALSDALSLGTIEAPVAKLYLRAAGQQQPYATHTVRLERPATPDLDTMPSTVPALSEASGKPTVETLNVHDGDRAAAEEWMAAGTPPAQAESDLATLNAAPEQPIVAPSSSERLPILPWLLAGIGVSVAGFAIGLWAMSRPCAIGACEPLQTAQTLSQQATQTLQTAKTEQDLQQAQQQFTEATRLLAAIPAWSSHHGDAQTLQQTDQAQAETLNLVLTAERKADAAIQKSQALPQTAAALQTTQALWREAIAQLQTVPTTSPLHTFAQQRLVAYEADLAATGKLTTAEQQAQKSIAVAKETARVAETRQGIAQTVENWQLAQSTWQVAINTLKQIPNSTTSYAEAQQLLVGYQSKLAAVRDRATQEQIAQKTFNQALTLAQKAEAAQRQNQWSQAVANWREAVSTIRQVPNNTAYSEPAQPLVASYGTSLKQAEAQFQAATAQQRTRSDLDRVCAGTPKLCTYAIASDVIRVQFTAAYERKLRTAFIVGRAGDYGTLGGAVNHIETLQTALQTISDNAGLPLEVYSAASGELIGSFNPKG